MSVVLVFVFVFAIIFEFINGFHDTANAIATTVFTRVLTVGKAIILAACMNFVGALVSENVAKTITAGIVSIDIEEYVVVGALIGAIIWNLFTWWRSIPSSSSHALIGSLIGATVVYSLSFQGIQWDGILQKVIIPLVTSPVMGFILALFFMKLVNRIFAHHPRKKVNGVFRRLQLLSAALVAFSHGSNDAQKTMGIITLALITANILPVGSGVPIWVKIICAAAMAAGTATGGRRIMKTMGGKVTKLNNAGGFVSETSSALVIQSMSMIGAPISTTQVISAAVMGVGAAKRLKSVKWKTVGNIAITWVVTLPATAILGGLAVFIIQLFV